MAATLEVPKTSPVEGSMTLIPFFFSALLMKNTLKDELIPTAPIFTMALAKVRYKPDLPTRRGLVMRRKNMATVIAEETAMA